MCRRQVLPSLAGRWVLVLKKGEEKLGGQDRLDHRNHGHHAEEFEILSVDNWW